MTQAQRDIAAVIDHSLLRPNLSDAQLDAGCREAAALHVASVCILPHWVLQATRLLKGSGVRTSTVIGFPHGAHTMHTKAFEARCALDDGAVELDMVCNISKAVSNEWTYVQDDIAGVLEHVRAANAKLKVIFENCYLDDAQKIELCRICSALQVDWVKTSTGYGTGGATEADVRLMREHTAPTIGVKAAGGIGNLATLRAFLGLGCTRIGLSRTAAILAELEGAAPAAGDAAY